MTNIFESNKIHLPPVLRSVASMVAFVRTIFAPLQILSTDFDGYTEGVNYDLQFNGQVIYLEHWLNDLHDATQRRIYISDPQPSNILPTVVYNFGENQPTTIVRNHGESGATARVYNHEELATRYDFVVFIPLSIWTTEREKLIRAQVNRKKQAGKMFVIQTF
jgi:hypothetical protein